MRAAGELPFQALAVQDHAHPRLRLREDLPVMEGLRRNRQADGADEPVVQRLLVEFERASVVRVHSVAEAQDRDLLADEHVDEHR